MLQLLLASYAWIEIHHRYFFYNVNIIVTWTYYKWTVYGEPFFDLHDRHRHLVVCMLMSTSKRLDNDDYVIMQRHWQKKHFPVRYNLAGVPLKIRLWINTTECSGAAKLKTLQFVWYDFENYWFAHFRTRMRVCPTSCNTCPLPILRLISLEYYGENW